MNRQDFAMALGQADQLGNTLLQNRVMQQQKQEREADRGLRERMFTEQQNTRKETSKMNNAWRTQNEDQQNLQLLLKANADGSLDDAGRAKANAWLAQHPQLSGTGIQLVKPQPKQAGQFNTAPGHNLEILTQLRQDVAKATTPEGKAQASQKLDDFMALTRRGSNEDDGMETVTETIPADAGQEAIPAVPGEKRSLFGIDALAKDKPATAGEPGRAATPEKKITYKQKRGETKAASSKPLDRAATTAQSKLEPGKYLKRQDGKIRVMNPEGVKGWATLDPNNLPEGCTLTD